MYVDADGHVMEPHDVWVGRMDERRWGDLIPRYVAEDFDGKDSWYVGGVRRAAGSAIFGCSAASIPKSCCHARGSTPKATQRRGTPSNGAHARRRGHRRPVLYPSLSLTFGPLDPIEAVRDRSSWRRCIGRTTTGWQSSAPPPPLACSPRRRCLAGHRPRRGRSAPCGGRPRREEPHGPLGGVRRRTALQPSRVRPFWATCQELGVPVGFHPATQPTCRMRPRCSS